MLIIYKYCIIVTFLLYNRLFWGRGQGALRGEWSYAQFRPVQSEPASQNEGIVTGIASYIMILLLKIKFFF